MDWNEARARQSQELYEIICDAVMSYSSKQDSPYLNAVASALAACLGQTLATITDARQRQALRASVDRALSDYETGDGFGDVVVKIVPSDS